MGSLRKPMYVDRKWSFHVNPAIPGGPSGERAMKNIMMVTFTPMLGLTIFIPTLLCYSILIMATMRIGIYLIYPLLFDPLFSSATRFYLCCFHITNANGGAGVVLVGRG